ncbi:MAG: 16S rRNA (cytosine(967)-C(5))-methyltransferase [Thermoanaerobaculia bacterium]|nr:16S rRNA (cytosine(967)-C(5))-methyltransferase [Thermoanaerobaculia bacterium]
MDPGVRRQAAPDVRAAAVRVVERTLASRSSAEGLLARAAATLDERDRRLLAELVYGTLRWKLRLEDVVTRASGRPMARIDPRLRAVLLVGACQLLTLDRVPAHAAVDAAAGEARRRGGGRAAGFVNAVLRRIAAAGGLDAWPVEATDPVLRLAIEQSHPPELVARWIDRFGLAAASRMLAAGNGPRAPHALAFADRGGREALRTALADEGIASASGVLAPGALVLGSPEALASLAFARGDFYVQDEASQAAALVPPPRPGERVLDAAAAPGGKGLAILAAEPAASVLLADLAPRRLARLRANLIRLGRALPMVAADAAHPPWRPASFDRVVLDAPCSGTGTLRRHPELRWRFRAGELARLADAALAMLFALAPAVRPGGLLVHVTCSVEAEENEEVARRFLAAREGYVADPLAVDDPVVTAGRQAAGRWRVLPGDGHDGFSVAVWRRRK